MCLDRRTQTLRTREEISSFRCYAQRRASPAAFSVNLCQKKTICRRLNVILGKLHEGTRWPIELFRPSGNDTADTSVLHHSYILFVWNGEASGLNETLDQVENLKYSITWNPRGRFLVVATDSRNEPAQLLAAHICSVLWQVARICQRGGLDHKPILRLSAIA